MVARVGSMEKEARRSVCMYCPDLQHSMYAIIPHLLSSIHYLTHCATSNCDHGLERYMCANSCHVRYQLAFCARQHYISLGRRALRRGQMGNRRRGAVPPHECLCDVADRVQGMVYFFLLC